MQIQMKYKLSFFLVFLFVLISCKNDNQKRLVENEKETKKQEVIFSNINKGWFFYDTPINTVSETTAQTWNEWRQFLAELAQKPKKTISAFQQKAKAISIKATELNTNIPPLFNTPQIRSRINTLITQVRLLDLFLHLDAIPDKKVVVIISEINKELVSLQRQMDKIVEKSKIPIEEGESELMKMKDSARAIPNTFIDPNTPRVE